MTAPTVDQIDRAVIAADVAVRAMRAGRVVPDSVSDAWPMLDDLRSDALVAGDCVSGHRCTMAIRLLVSAYNEAARKRRRCDGVSALAMDARNAARFAIEAHERMVRR